ncbi:uncharacterized protein LOC104893548 [Beta vulgaris subsp. vulgaris]|uniref:uncharacterized protein LOC104893548 n=1 Tax=Beta vulgaris subsp. vulgaris TaxID=3555 RepID=UPI00053F682D|nr:uncharacterized protein LOC104893548 [Beta vulgaris subsp. vulgaris]
MPTDDSPPPVQNDIVDENEGEDNSKTNIEQGNVDEVRKQKEKVTDSPTPPLPFPHRMHKSKVDKELDKLLAMVKNLEITVPFTDLISQVPVYAKFLKDMITKKKDFGGIYGVALTEECALFIDKALCDLGASVSVMPLSICNKMNLGVLNCTQIPLQMVDQSVKYPLGILEDVPVRVGKFYILVDFVVLDMEEDSQIPIIFGRSFLCMLVLLLMSSPEIAGDDAPRALLDDPLDVVLAFGASKGEVDDEIDSLLPDLAGFDTDEAEGFEVMQITCSTSEPHVKKVELKQLPSHLRYALLDDNENRLVFVSVKLDDSQLLDLLTVLRMHKKAIGYNIDDPKDFIENIMEVFMDDFSVHGSDFDMCLHNLSKVLKRCCDVNLILNWEKFHLMVNEGVVLSHLVFEHDIQVNRANIEVIEKLPPPVNVKGVRSFLGHVGFYRRFIEDISKVAKPLTQLLLKDATFDFTDACLESFDRIKKALITALIIQTPY